VTQRSPSRRSKSPSKPTKSAAITKRSPAKKQSERSVRRAVKSSAKNDDSAISSSALLEALLKFGGCPSHTHQPRSFQTLKRSLEGLGWNLDVTELPSLKEVMDAFEKRKRILKVEIEKLSPVDPERFTKQEEFDRIHQWFCSLVHNWSRLSSLDPTLSTIDVHRAGHVDTSAFLTKECPVKRVESLSKLCRRYTDAPYSLDSKERRRRLEALEKAAAAKMGTTSAQEWLKLHPPGTNDPLLETIFREIDRLWFDGDLAVALHDAHVHLKLKFAEDADELDDASGTCSKRWCDVTVTISARDTFLLPFEEGRGYFDAGRIIRTPLQALLTTFEHELIHLLSEAVCRCEWAKAYKDQRWEEWDGQPYMPHPPPPYTAFEMEHMHVKRDGHGPIFCRLAQTLFGHTMTSSGLDPKLQMNVKILEYQNQLAKDQRKGQREAIRVGSEVQWRDLATMQLHQGTVVETSKKTFAVREGTRVWMVEYDNPHIQVV
jgi:hypothetical protein